MSNVFGVAWRTPCLGLRPPSLHPPNSIAPFRSFANGRQTPTWLLDNTPRRLFSSAKSSSVILSPSTTSKLQCLPITNRIRSRCFQTSSAVLASAKPKAPPVETGVFLRNKPFSKAEIVQIFGPQARLGPTMGNRVLSVLQGRRLAGTLDLDFPADITRAAPPATLDAGLEYLRKNYPVDEDAAIMERIEREEREEEERLRRQAEELGLYKPQSGSYGAELGKNNDVSGKSILEQMRTRNEKKNEEEAERKRQEWLQGEAAHNEKMKAHAQKNLALQEAGDKPSMEIGPRADPHQRPVLAYYQKKYIEAMDTETDMTKITTRQRLLPSLIFTILAIALLYGFAATYQPPARQDRMWPNTPPAAATIATIIGMNAAVWFLWKVPPAWKLLNRYFLNVTANPRVLSLAGSVFSHQTVRHLAMNMLALWLLGTQTHDDIGRGNFLALYLASGILGCYASLTIHVLKGALHTTSLGASGGVCGVIAANALIDLDTKWTIAFLPYSWQETIAQNGWKFLAFLVLVDLYGASRYLLKPGVHLRIDHHAHLAGYASGAAFAVYYREKKRRERERRASERWLGGLIR
ncbi:hypothetical protein BDV19DRAFT_14103 [Aspergillus venezuelensis]